MSDSIQREIDSANQEFWNELCGSPFASANGIVGNSLESLQKFDQLFYEYYPYLHRHIPVEIMKGKNVLEVGLGYGTVGLKIAQAGAHYTALDIAEKPVKMMKHRLQLYGLQGVVLQGSMLECPLSNESQDIVVSIGCFHHTGNMQKCVDETYRVLKPGGRAYIMVYNRFSYRQWIQWPRKTFFSLLSHVGVNWGDRSIGDDQRKAYDCDSLGRAAPETVLSSQAELRKLFRKFSKVKMTKENCDDYIYTRFFQRRHFRPILGRLLGLDIYISVLK